MRDTTFCLDGIDGRHGLGRSSDDSGDLGCVADQGHVASVDRGDDGAGSIRHGVLCGRRQHLVLLGDHEPRRECLPRGGPERRLTEEGLGADGLLDGRQHTSVIGVDVRREEFEESGPVEPDQTLRVGPNGGTPGRGGPLVTNAFMDSPSSGTNAETYTRPTTLIASGPSWVTTAPPYE